MDFEKLVEKYKALVKKPAFHKDHEHCVKLAKEYKAHVSGVGLSDMLKQFNKREDENMFKQRKRLTELISKPVASSIKKPFYKISRNQNVISEIKVEDKPKDEAIKIMMSKFYGTNSLNKQGLDFWLKNRFLELSFVDPNAFVVVEWLAKNPTEILEPYPFEVSSEEAINYTMKNGVLKSLTTRIKVNRTFKSDKLEVKSVDSFTFYEEGFSVTICEFCPKYYAEQGITLSDKQKSFKEEKKNFLLTYNETNLDFIPAFRVGYLRDDATDGRTLVSPFDSALPYFRKMLKAVSELDLSITLHTFPQKIQFVSACKHSEGNQRCVNGRLSLTQETCPNCSGTGLEVHRSGQDAIYYKMPEDPSEMFDIEKTLAYKSPPIELIKFQDEYVRSLKKDAHLSVFNSTMFLTTDPEFAKTATEIDFNSEGIHDTLFPFSEKYSEAWRTIVKIFVKLSGHSGDYAIKHQFPSDLKIKTTSMLINELKTANDSNAPSFFIDQISSQLAQQIYNGDALSLTKYETRHKFYPFNGKSKDEVMFLMTSSHVSEKTKVLYANFETIFEHIEKKNPSFYSMEFTKQNKIVEEAVKEFEENIKKENTSTEFRFDFGNDENPEGGQNSEPTD